MFELRVAAIVCCRILCKRSFNSSVKTNYLTKFPLVSLDFPDIWHPPKPKAAPILTPTYNDHETTTTEIDGKSIANDIKATLTTQVINMKNAIRTTPGLAIILIGKRKDSQSFIRIKKIACEEVGITSLIIDLPEESTESQVLDVVSFLNHKESIHGILVQLPLPSHLSEQNIVNAVNVEKDVDGFHPVNIGNLAMAGREPLFIACAASGCVEVLNQYGVEIRVSVVHAFTKNPEEVTREADILVSDVGVPNLVQGHWLKPGAVVIDLGCTLITDIKGGSSVAGDVCYKEAIRKASLITPVPGGMGPVTISMLLWNTVEAAKRAYQWTEKS